MIYFPSTVHSLNDLGMKVDTVGTNIETAATNLGTVATNIANAGTASKTALDTIGTNVKEAATNIKSSGDDAKLALETIGTNIETAATNIATVGDNIKTADDNSKTSLEALKQSIKDFTSARTTDTTSLVTALNEYKTTLSADFDEVKQDLETIAANILSAKVRAEQFASIKRLADKIECTEDCFVSASQADAIIRGMEQNDASVGELLDDINAKSSNVPAGEPAGRFRSSSLSVEEEPTKSKRSSSNEEEPTEKQKEKVRGVDMAQLPKVMPPEIQIVKDIFNGVAQLRNSSKPVNSEDIFDQVKSAFGINPNASLELRSMKEVVESSRVVLNKTADTEAKEEAKRKIDDFLQHSTRGVSPIKDNVLKYGGIFAEKFATMMGLISPMVLLAKPLVNKFVRTKLKPGGYHHGNVTDNQERELPFDQLHNFV